MSDVMVTITYESTVVDAFDFVVNRDLLNQFVHDEAVNIYGYSLEDVLNDTDALCAIIDRAYLNDLIEPHEVTHLDRSRTKQYIDSSHLTLPLFGGTEP